MLEITSVLKDKLASLLGKEDVKSSLDSVNYEKVYGMSSIEIVKYLLLVEEVFDIEFDFDELGVNSFKSFTELQKSIERHLSEKQ